MLHTDELERVRKYRLGQAEERGVLNAARSWFSLNLEVYADSRATWIGEGVAAECRDNTIRVWSDLDAADIPTVTRAVGSGPMTTPEQNLSLEVVREIHRVSEGYDYVLEGYVPGDWEIAFFTHVSSLCLEQRLEDRRRAIADEAKDREVLQRQLRRWDV